MDKIHLDALLFFSLNCDGHLVEMEVKRLSPDNRTRFVEGCLPPKARYIVVPTMDHWKEAESTEEKRFLRIVWAPAAES